MIFNWKHALMLYSTLNFFQSNSDGEVVNTYTEGYILGIRIYRIATIKHHSKTELELARIVQTTVNNIPVRVVDTSLEVEDLSDA